MVAARSDKSATATIEGSIVVWHFLPDDDFGSSEHFSLTASALTHHSFSSGLLKDVTTLPEQLLRRQSHAHDGRIFRPVDVHGRKIEVVPLANFLPNRIHGAAAAAGGWICCQCVHRCTKPYRVCCNGCSSMRFYSLFLPFAPNMLVPLRLHA